MTGSFYEFFSGGGMARLGLGAAWSCVFANDLDQKKASAYSDNHSAEHLYVGDVRSVKPNQLPGRADLAWASFPCQDLSLAGSGAGLRGERSGTFWPFWQLMLALEEQERPPKIVALENVSGAITNHQGEDFREIAGAFSSAGYSFGAIILDAVHWVPQSRPRLFIVGVSKDIFIPPQTVGAGPDDVWHPAALRRAYSGLPEKAKESWVWWQLPMPPARNMAFTSITEKDPTGTDWHTPEKTEYLLSLMTPLNLSKVNKAQELSVKEKRRLVGGVYRRTRDGKQRAEVRFDDVSGCLRTPTGGSSRQTIIVIEDGQLRSRLLSTREAARLMGVPDEYVLPSNYNTAYHVMGDGVVVPVVRHLAEHVFEPILAANNIVAAAE